jgi:hypothetical protein
VTTVPETQKAAEAGSTEDDDTELESLLQENKLSSKHDESQDLFGVEEKVHHWPPGLIYCCVHVHND